MNPSSLGGWQHLKSRSRYEAEMGGAHCQLNRQAERGDQISCRLRLVELWSLHSEMMKMLKGRFEVWLVLWSCSWQWSARSTSLSPPRIDDFRRPWRTGGSVYPSAFHTTTSNVTSSPIILSRSSSQYSTAVAYCSSPETLYYPNSYPLSHFEKMFGKPGDSAAIVYDRIGRVLSLPITEEKPPMPR